MLARVEPTAMAMPELAAPPPLAHRWPPGGAWIVAAIVFVAMLGAIALIAQRTDTITDEQIQSHHLLTRADDYYFQFSRGDNEAAIELYERVLGMRPDDALAMAGLANALTQRSIRWPTIAGDAPREFTRLGDALANGHLDNEPARAQLQRAQQLAERAVAIAADSPVAHKALGFVASAQRRFDIALTEYQRAISLDPDAWGPLINLGDLFEINGKREQALPYFERAYAAMGRVYDRNPVQVRPWYANLGVLIATRYRARNDMFAAESWFRRVLSQSPLHPAATVGLAEVLRAGGDDAQAVRLCDELAQRTGVADACTRPPAR
jgi:tetratricopeptide (TPR) repeat protein